MEPPQKVTWTSWFNADRFSVLQPQRNPYGNAAYMPNGASPHPGAVPGAMPLLPNQGRVIQSGPIRVLCIADVRGISPSTIPRPVLYARNSFG